jgi:hypothetical protein
MVVDDGPLTMPPVGVVDMWSDGWWTVDNGGMGNASDWLLADELSFGAGARNAHHMDDASRDALRRRTSPVFTTDPN